MSTKALVDRARLIDVLRAGHSKKLTVIHGPTGFGKSTLAAQWAKLLTAEGVAVAWLTVDHDDNNVVWFLSHLIEAIRAVTPALATELGEVLEEHGDEAERYVLTSLINEIHESGHAHDAGDRRLAARHRPGDHRGAAVPARLRL